MTLFELLAWLVLTWIGWRVLRAAYFAIGPWDELPVLIERCGSCGSELWTQHLHRETWRCSGCGGRRGTSRKARCVPRKRSSGE